MTTDDGPLVNYKLTLWAFGSGELINWKSTPDTPKFWNRLVQLIRMGKSTGQMWVKLVNMWCSSNVWKGKNWAMSWDYGTFCPPQTHSTNAHAQPSSGARCLIFGRTLRLLPYFMCANSEGAGETAWMWTVRLYYKVICPKDADRMANSLDPSGAIWSWSALFAQICLSEYL